MYLFIITYKQTNATYASLFCLNVTQVFLTRQALLWSMILTLINTEFLFSKICMSNICYTCTSPNGSFSTYLNRYFILNINFNYGLFGLLILFSSHDNNNTALLLLVWIGRICAARIVCGIFLQLVNRNHNKWDVWSSSS